MKRAIVSSEGDLINLMTRILEKEGYGLEKIESMLKVEFAYVDGTFQKDRMEQAMNDLNDNWEWENQDVDTKVYRRQPHCTFPTSYPAMVLYAIDSDYDRTGPVSICLFEFVTKDEAKKLLSTA